MAETKLAIRKAEDIFNELMQNPSDVVLTPRQALAVWNVFRSSYIDVSLVSPLKARAFLQAALMSAIDGSFAMSWVESLFRSAYSPTATVGGIMKGLVKTGFKHYYRHLRHKPPELYLNVIRTIAWSHRPYFDEIEQIPEE